MIKNMAQKGGMQMEGRRFSIYNKGDNNSRIYHFEMILEGGPVLMFIHTY